MVVITVVVTIEGMSSLRLFNSDNSILNFISWIMLVVTHAPSLLFYFFTFSL